MSREAVRKRKARESETADQHRICITKQRENNRQKKVTESPEVRKVRLERDRIRKKKSLAEESDEQRKKRLKYCRERETQLRNKNVDEIRDVRLGNSNLSRKVSAMQVAQQNEETNPERNQQQSDEEIRAAKQVVEQNEEGSSQRNQQQNVAVPSARNLSQTDQDLLQKFRSKVDKFKYTLCPVCNERFMSITLIKGECRRCHAEKSSTKKFSAENNMDPGEVPEELKDLSEIEEMLIARVFPVLSVYRLRGGQHGYRGNVINFPQDVGEFASRLPRSPSSLDLFVVRRESENDSAGFKDFKIRRTKVARALLWLKENNEYYANITIDGEILGSLPIDGSIDDQLSNKQKIDEGSDYDDENVINEDPNCENEDDVIRRTFVAVSPSFDREDDSIQKAINRLYTESCPVVWPKIKNEPINEFETAGYIACAFPTLYPTGNADLRQVRIREVNPAEYFKHLLLYKDGRFARHSRWRYFALNSQMRWRALQEGKVYIKQSLNDTQITVEDIQERINQGDKHIADRIMRFGEGLRGSRQFWNARRNELSDMIKQIGTRGLVFFTFSAADTHWPELHNLMPSRENSEGSTRAKRNLQNIVDNPLITDWFFNKRFEIYFNDVLKRQWDLEDWWYRFEWQHRGSVHVHGIGKRRNATKIDWKQMKENENIMNEVVQYLDNLVTTINPGLDMPVPEQHPCQKKNKELRDDQQDYIDLINKLQRHTRCNPSYCLRINREGKQVCRFGYPKEIVERTFVRND